MDRATLEEFLKRKFAELAGVDPAQLQEAQTAQQNTNMVTDLGRLGSGIGQAIGRYKGDNSQYDRMDARAAQPMLSLQQQKSDREKQKMEIAKYLLGKEEQAAWRSAQLGRQNSADQYQRERDEKQDSYRKERDRKEDEFRQQSLTQKQNAKLKPSATQSKKAGLYKIGVKAEQQYQDALKNGSYNPTAPGQFIDNSSWAPNWMKDSEAVEAKAAANSWIDSFLRDESGAAIPDDERARYYEIYFPQPGDDENTVANKLSLRQQKMENARVDAGPAIDQAGPSLGGMEIRRVKDQDGKMRRAKFKDKKFVEWAD